MLRTAFLCLLIIVSVSSTSVLRKSIKRRQSDPEYCQAIEGFDCKCSHYRVTCTSDRDLPASLNVLQKEKQKYQSVELIINGERDQNVYEYTFEPVKQLFKADSDNLEFRIKFEKYTALHLSSPGIFNRIFPDNALPTARKHMAVEIYNPLVQPNDNVNLFANLEVDSLELYVLYPFRGTFQQLFSGANIKYLRLSGGDIKSDLSQPFTGNIGRLELAKQAGQLTVQNFPLYPAHELIINAFYVTDFTSEHPPNYSNLGELRLYTQERVPANAFRNYPNLHTLSISTEKEIDPHALDGLYKLEKLTIKDTKPSLELLNNLHSIKEFEASIEKLDEREQCQLIEKLANGQVAVQAIPSGRECTCASAYLDTASGRYPCDAQNCDQSSCAAIKNNYDSSTRTFKAPPAIKRADGSDALRQRDAKVYSGAYQITNEDQEKLQQAGIQQSGGQDGADGVTDGGQKQSRRTRPRGPTTPPSSDGQEQPDQAGQPDVQNDEDDEEGNDGRSEFPSDYPNDYEDNSDTTFSNWIKEFAVPVETDDDNTMSKKKNDQNGEQGETVEPNEGGENQQGEGTENRQQGEGGHEHNHDPNQSTEAGAIAEGEGSAPPSKKGFGWLPIIIIAASVAGLLIIGLIIILIRRKRATGYSQTRQTEHTTT